MLGVSRATLYAYVSRGLVRTRNDPNSPKRQGYDIRDIERLSRNKTIGKRPKDAAARALNLGFPVLRSHLTFISEENILYRGRNVVDLASSASLEDTARLLWGCAGSNPFDDILDYTCPAIKRALPLVERCQCALAHLSATGPAGWLRAPHLLWSDAVTVLKTLTDAVIGESSPDLVPVHLRLGQLWQAGNNDIIRKALVLVADHELNSSAFAVRVVASTGASLSASVMAGLASFNGPLHGGQIERVAHLFNEAERAGDAAAVVAGYLRRGEILAGFGQPLYPDGDPRAAALMASMEEDELMRALRCAVQDATGQQPNIDFALVAMARSLSLPESAPFVIFMLGRSVGWIAHALEQLQSGQIIRPRAEYVGRDSADGEGEMNREKPPG